MQGPKAYWGPNFWGPKFLGDQISWGPKKSGAQMRSGTISVTATYMPVLRICHTFDYLLQSQHFIIKTYLEPLCSNKWQRF